VQATVLMGGVRRIRSSWCCWAWNKAEGTEGSRGNGGGAAAGGAAATGSGIATIVGCVVRGRAVPRAVVPVW